MKIQILTGNSSPIEGYGHFRVENESINLSILSDNECEFILANEAVDDFSTENIAVATQAIVKKLRLGGTIVIGGTDVRLFSKAVVNCTINETDASSIIKSKRSMSTAENIINLMSRLGLKVQNSVMSGIHYEVTAIRG